MTAKILITGTGGIMTSDTRDVSVNSSPLTAYYMPRPRIDEVFDRAARCNLIFVTAGAGYGKTQAVHQYIGQQENSAVRWMQLTESDNIGSHFWENLTHCVTFDDLDLAARLRELGFPDTPARFQQFAALLKNAEKSANRTFNVLDDFHLIHSKQVLAFTERCAHLHIPGSCLIVISRSEPEINAVSLFSKSKASIITEEELRFNESEIAAFYTLRGIPFSSRDLPKLHEATGGWALAINLLSLMLVKIPQNLGLALDAMKQNIFKLFETEAFREFPEDIQKIMIKLSLVSELPLTPLRSAVSATPLAQYMTQLASFVWFDNFTGDYRVHPLYLEFLQNKHHILSDEEKLDTYQRAAQWCVDNGLYTDAIKFCAKSCQFGRITEILFSYPIRLPGDVCEYVLGIVEEIDTENEYKEDKSVLFLKNFFIPILLIGMGKFEEARERSFETIREWESVGTPFSLHLLSAAYSNLTYIDIYTCTVTHVYDAPKYLKKSLEYRAMSNIPSAEMSGTFSSVDLRSFACLIGEGAELAEFDRFLESAREAAAYIAETPHKMYYGYDDLAACEVSFFKNELETARNFAHNAVMKAREKNQYGIEMMAQYYLLRAAIHDGDYPLAKETLRQMSGLLDNQDFWNRHMLFDLFTGSFYIHMRLPDMAPSWLALDEKETISAVHIPTRELIVGVRYYFSCGKYKQALAVLCNSYPRALQERFLFGELVLSLLMAIARYMTGDAPGAVDELEKSYKMSFDGVFEMPFIEMAKYFRPIAEAALAKEGCIIPDEWLKTVIRKASIYAKKTAIVSNSLKKEKNIKDNVKLSEREVQVLSDLRHGLSREEIAENRYLSIHTVKSVLRSIYNKLDANNNVDAVLIAIDRKLID